MTVALVLFSYATVLCTGAFVWLRRSSWPARSPRLGIVAWLALTGSAVASVTLGGLALAVPTVGVSANLSDVLHACAMALRAQYMTPGGAAAGASGAVLGLAVLARCLYCLVNALVEALHARNRQHETLTMVGRRVSELDALVVPHSEPAVYCLPGRGRRIVITTSALTILDDRQLTAALAHERAHLAGRHDLLLAWVIALSHAFPRVRLFTTAENEVARLVEMLADDIATRHTQRHTLAGALLALAGARAPAAALGVGGSTAASRVRRLIDPARPLNRPSATVGFLSTAAVLVVPLLVFSAPALAAVGMNFCPPTHTTAVAAKLCAPQDTNDCR